MKKFPPIRKYVLIADTDDETTMNLRSWLSDFEISICTVKNENEALSAFLELPVSALLIDALLPSKGGLSAMERLRRARGGESANIFLLNSLRSSAALEREALNRHNAAGVLRKPLVREQVEASLLKYLPKHHEKADTSPEILNEETPQQGEFRQDDLPGLIAGIIKRGESCQLALGSGKTRKIASFKDGRLVNCMSNLVSDTLGRHLLNAYNLDPEVYREAIDVMIATKKKTGEILIDMGAMDKQTIDRAVLTNVIEKFLDTFRWQQGWFRVQPYQEASFGLPGEIDSAPLLWDAIWEHLPDPVCEEILSPHAHRKMRLTHESSDWALELPAKITQKSVARWAKKLDNSTLDENIEELKKKKNLMTALYLLLRGHMVFIDPAGTGFGKKRNPAWSIDASDRQLGQALRFLEELKGMNHFQVLNVKLGASAEEIKNQFREAAALYHPDALEKSASGELRQIVTDIFAIFSEAYQVLYDPYTRVDYKEEIEVANALTQAEVELSAEAIFQEALSQYQNGDYSAAVKTFKDAIKLNPDASDYYVWLGRATLKLGKPDRQAAQAEALQQFRKAHVVDPNLPAPLVELGTLMLSMGEEDRAMSFFVRALHVSPRDKDILRQLQLIQKRSGGKFGKRIEAILGMR